jgi:predicted nucleic acid-binding Zn ribbon protein
VRRRPEPRPLSQAIAALADRLAPQTTLAEIQRVWPAVVGPVIAAQAEPTSEREGVLRVTCSAAVWAQELDLMGPELVARLNAALGAEAVAALRCSSASAKERPS